MDEVSKRNFNAISQRLSEIERELSYLRQDIINYRNQVGNTLAKLTQFEGQINMLIAKVYGGGGPTVKE